MIVESPKLNKDGATIILIEDDPLLTKMYEAKFTSEGFRVLIAHNGQEGLELATSESADIVILDIMMPKLSGIDLLEKLRKSKKGKDIPVIILTNLTEKEEREKAIKLGVKEYLIKTNVTPGEIVEKIHKHLK